MRKKFIVALLVSTLLQASEQQTPDPQSIENLVQAHASAVCDFECARTNYRASSPWKSWKQYQAAKKQYTTTFEAACATVQALGEKVLLKQNEVLIFMKNMRYDKSKNHELEQLVKDQNSFDKAYQKAKEFYRE